MDRSRRYRPGLTAIELAVVTAIVGVLMGLLLAGIQRMREAANQIACGNNLKQIGLAFGLYHDMNKVLPTDGGGIPRPIPDVNGTPFIVTSTTRSIQQTYTLELCVGDPSLGPDSQTGSWAYSILPFIEQDAVFRNRLWTQGVKLYACPSRRSHTPQLATNDEFGEYVGGGWVWGKTDYSANALVIRGSPIRVSLAVITDGCSETLLVGEKSLSTRLYESGSWFGDEPFFLGGTFSLRRSGTIVQRDPLGTNYLGTWGSAHASVANFLFADGSVRRASFEVPSTIVEAWLTPNGGEPVSGN